MLTEQTNQRQRLRQAQFRCSIKNTSSFLQEHHEKSPNIDRDHHKCKMNACFVKLFTAVPACFSPHVSVNIMMTCVRQKCGYHTMHSTFYYFFKQFMCISTCVICRKMLPHASSYGLHMLCLLGTHKKFHEVNI